VSGEELERAITFLIDQQAKIQGSILDLSVAGLKTDRRIRRLTRRAEEHQQWLSRNTFEIQILENKLSEITDKINFIIDREIKQKGLPG
jgi:hypothetical protein